MITTKNCRFEEEDEKGDGKWNSEIEKDSEIDNNLKWDKERSYQISKGFHFFFQICVNLRLYDYFKINSRGKQ